jgi:predicted helicase
VRENPKLSGTTHNVFGIQVGVGITVAVRNSNNSEKALYYYRVPEYWHKTDKLTFLSENKSISYIDWLNLQPDEKHTWITEGIHPEFSTFLPIGIKKPEVPLHIDIPAIFNLYSGGIKTNRDTWAYNFNPSVLKEKMKILIELYNSDVDRWKRSDKSNIAIDDFVTYDDERIKWSGDLKVQLMKGKYASLTEKSIRYSLYRPFVKKYLYFDPLLNNSIYLQHLFFPIYASEFENRVICVPGPGDRKGFGCLTTNTIPNLDLSFEKVQCFPFYTYSEDGSTRRENITDWALQQFQTKYGPDVTKWDIFHYVYGMLHHPEYRERYKENLKRDLPHVPLLNRQEAFETCVRIGKQLMDIHLNYEQAREYPLDEIENPDVPFSTHVEKMKLTPDRTAVIVNESLTLSGIPQECFLYRLGNRSALEWVIDQYQVSKDKRSGIESDPNRIDDQGYIVRLVAQVITVSVETVKLVNALAQAVRVEDWLGEAVEVKG